MPSRRCPPGARTGPMAPDTSSPPPTGSGPVGPLHRQAAHHRSSSTSANVFTVVPGRAFLTGRGLGQIRRSVTSSGRSPSGGMGRACSVGRVGCAVPGPVGAVLHIRPAPAGGESAESCENTPAFSAGEILPCAERTLLHMGALPLKTDLLERTPESCGKPGIHPQGRPFPMYNTSTTGPGRPRPAREGPHREPGPVRAPRETPPPPRRSPAPHRRPRRERPGEPFSSG